MHMYVLIIASQRPLIDAHFPYMETAGQILYFDGTQVYMVVACSFAAFSDSYVTGTTVDIMYSSFCPISSNKTQYFAFGFLPL